MDKHLATLLHRTILTQLEQGDYFGVKQTLHQYNMHIDKLNADNMPEEMVEYYRQRRIELKEHRRQKSQ